MNEPIVAPAAPAPVILRPEFLTADVLPNCLAKDRKKGAVWNKDWGVWMIPIYCYWCGDQHGSVVENDYDFAYYICNECFAEHGPATGTMVIPDDVFWEKIRIEQMERYGRLLSNEELQAVVDANSSPLATLILQGR